MAASRLGLRLGVVALLAPIASWTFGGCGLSTSGMAQECANLAECDDAEPCTVDRCESGVCSHTPAPDGEPPEQVSGDCRRASCRGGKATYEIDDADEDDSNVCTKDACKGGKATHDGAPLEGDACAIGMSAGTCKAGTCVVVCEDGGPPCDDGIPCTEDSCDLTVGTCLFDPTPLDGKTPKGVDDLPADCKDQICSNGTLKEMPDDSEVPHDGNDCTADSCAGGHSKFKPLGAGTPCGVTGKCDGRGSCVGCNTPDDCGRADECSMPTCVDNKCGVTYAPEGTQIEDQEAGDCQVLVCDGAGAVVGMDADDPQSDGNPCTQDTCVGGVQKHPPEPSGTPCPGQKVCSGSGACVECVDDSSCDSPDTCGGAGVANQCGCTAVSKQSTCAGKCGTVTNNCQDQVDCGQNCPSNKTCGGGGVANQCGCSPGHCCDAATDSDESDVDCGGNACALCVNGKHCNSSSDCQSNDCNPGQHICK